MVQIVINFFSKVVLFFYVQENHAQSACITIYSYFRDFFVFHEVCARVFLFYVSFTCANTSLCLILFMHIMSVLPASY